MSLKVILNVNAQLTLRLQSICLRRLFATKAKDDILESADEIPVFLEKRDDTDVEAKRNKSRLPSNHRNIVMGNKPYETSLMWYHDTIRYKKRTLGRYGMNALEEPAGLLWPTPEEVEDAKEYERVAFPLSLQERWKMIEEKHKAEEERKWARDKEIEIKMGKMNQWINEMHEKVAKKEIQLAEAKRRKDNLIEEVRRHFGFKISPHDDRFKELLAKKEKEDKKKQKEAKKAARAEKLKKMIESNASKTPKEGENIKEKNVQSKEGSPEVK